jgi:uncharacterized protein (DUF433 family)
MRKIKQAKLVGRHIVVDPKVCHGKPVFRGTRIMVWQVLEMLAEGLAWETIIEQCHHSITKDAIAEAIKLSREASKDTQMSSCWSLEQSLAVPRIRHRGRLSASCYALRFRKLNEVDLGLRARFMLHCSKFLNRKLRKVP